MVSTNAQVFIKLLSLVVDLKRMTFLEIAVLITVPLSLIPKKIL